MTRMRMMRQVVLGLGLGLGVEVIAALGVVLPCGEAEAARAQAVVVHVTRAGDTAESVAAAYYGNRALGLVVAEANGIARGKPIRSGRKLVIPTSTRFRARRDETLEQLAARAAGDTRRARWLAEWNGLAPRGRLREGTEVAVPYHLVHRARAGETLAELGRTYYGDASQAELLAAYNFRSPGALARGERVVLPMVLKVRRVRLTGARGRAAEREEARREAELAARVGARIEAAEKAYREGRYGEVPPALTKLLSEEDPSEKQLVEIHRLLAFSYVAIGAEESAAREFREVLLRDPEAGLDEATVSPKIRAVFERARRERPR